MKRQRPPHHNPALPKAAEQVLLKMLSRSADDRYPTAALFCADLAVALTGNGVTVRATALLPPTPPAKKVGQGGYPVSGPSSEC
jgi:hypothetical protein